MKKIIILIFCLFLTSCTKEKLQKFSKKSLDTGFNTFIELIAYTESEEEFNKYFKIMVDDFEKYNRLFDIYHNYDGLENLKTINDNAGIKEVVVDQEIIDLLLFSKNFQSNISSVFDISSGSVLREYHKFREQGQELNSEGKFASKPDLNNLKQLAKHIGMDNVEIDDNKNTVYIKDKETSIDVGGVAKGYVAEKIAIKLEKEGLKYGVINAGGNLKIVGPKPNNQKWTAGVQDPKGEVGSLIGFYVDGKQSVVTSGNYQNYYIAENNEIIHHIIDLRSLTPANNFESVTVVVNDSGLADALSTTFYTLNYQEGAQLLKKLNNQGLEIGLIYVSKDKLSDDNYIVVNQLYVSYNDTIKDLLIK